MAKPPSTSSELDLPGIKPSAPAAFTLTAAETAAKLFPFTGLTDPQLRNLHTQVDPATGAPWIPKPASGKYPTAATIAGVVRYLRHQADRTNRLPATFATMGDVETHLKFPEEMLKYALRNDCKARDASNRWDRDLLLEFFAPIFKKIFAANGIQLKGLEGMEGLDSDLQLARLRKEQADALVDEKLLRQGAMVLMPHVEEIIWEKGLSPLRAELMAMAKMIAALCNPQDPAHAQRIIEGHIGSLLKKIEAALPGKKAEAEKLEE
jgi:hypothetical protein